jgi:hypothetical protein
MHRCLEIEIRIVLGQHSPIFERIVKSLIEDWPATIGFYIEFKFKFKF